MATTMRRSWPRGQSSAGSESDPPAECTEVGGVETRSGDATESNNEMRNKAADMGANYVRWDTASSSGSSGTAYKCASAS
jgi:hypothetical protein